MMKTAFLIHLATMLIISACNSPRKIFEEEVRELRSASLSTDSLMSEGLIAGLPDRGWGGAVIVLG